MTISMFPVVRAVSAAVGLALGVAGVSHASPETQKNVPGWVSDSSRVASAAESDRVTIVAFLSLRNQGALKDLIAAQSSPSSTQYGRYLTPEQFHAQFSPNAADVVRVENALRKLGFHIDHVPDSGLFVRATGNVAQAKAAFGVSQDLYAYHGKVLRANAETPRIPAAIADVVRFVAGLDQTAVLRKPSHVRTDEAAATITAARLAAASTRESPRAPPPIQSGIASPVCSTYFGDHSATLSTAAASYGKTVPWLVCGYDPQQVRAAYGANKVEQDGSGVRIGIVDDYASPTIQDDVNRYSKNHGLPQLTDRNFRQIVPAGLFDVPASDPCGPQGWYGEESLDFAAVHSMAPGAYIIYSGTACTDPGNGGLYELIDHHYADIVTNSYGYGGEVNAGVPQDFIDSENQYFLQAAAEGMSILFSSGDNGDLAAANGEASGSWEATSPYVTAVGGTSLALLDHSGAKKEWGWGTYRVSMNGVTVAADGKTIATTGPALPFAFYSGSGGGPSLVELAPSYQSDVPYKLSGYTTLADGTVTALGSAYRVTPDISMVGDPYTGFLYGESFTIAGDPILDLGCKPTSATVEYCEESIGGTSLSSPLFAGVLALVNQARLQHHKSVVGFVNPALYGLGHGDDDSSEGAAIIDVKKPTSPTAVLRGYLGNPNKLRVVTMNSTLNPAYVPGGENEDTPAVLEGADTSYTTTRGYDEVTGLGTPNVPALIRAFERY